MQIVQWFMAVSFIAFSLFIGVGQWWAIYSIPKQLKAQGQPRNYSMIPLIGGVIGAIGCLISPIPELRQLWWLPLMIDPGCALMFGTVAVVAIVAAARRLIGFDPEGD